MAQTKQAATKHPVDEVLPFGQMFVYGLQHVMSMYAGVVAVPLIVGNAFGLPPGDITFLISAGLLMSGLATILQTDRLLEARRPAAHRAGHLFRSGFDDPGDRCHLRRRSRGPPRGVRRRHRGRHRRLLDRAVLHHAAAVLPRGGHRRGHHRHRHLAAAGRDALGGRRQPGRRELRVAAEHRPGLRHRGDHRLDLPVPARRLRAGRHPARAGPRAPWSRSRSG